MSNIIIGNPDTYERKIAHINPENTIVIADFDHTITAARCMSASSFNLIGTVPRLRGWFEVERTALFQKYHPYEIDPHLTKSERDGYMEMWWREAMGLHKRYQLSIFDIEDIDYDRSVIREGWSDFLGFCHTNSVPVHILSAGIWQVISKILEHHDMDYDNISVIANTLTWDDKWYNIWQIPESPIHAGNKQDHTVDTSEKHVILFWDSLDDASMAHTSHDDTTLRVAVYNPGTQLPLERYRKRYDVIIECRNPRDDGWYLGYVSTLLSRW